MKLQVGRREEKRGIPLPFLRTNVFVLDVTVDFEPGEIALMKKDGSWKRAVIATLQRTEDAGNSVPFTPSFLSGTRKTPFRHLAELAEFEAALVEGCKGLKNHIFNLEHMASGGSAKSEVNLD